MCKHQLRFPVHGPTAEICVRLPPPPVIMCCVLCTVIVRCVTPENCQIGFSGRGELLWLGIYFPGTINVCDSRPPDPADSIRNKEKKKNIQDGQIDIICSRKAIVILWACQYFALSILFLQMRCQGTARVNCTGTFSESWVVCLIYCVKIASIFFILTLISDKRLTGWLCLRHDLFLSIWLTNNDQYQSSRVERS